MASARKSWIGFVFFLPAGLFVFLGVALPLVEILRLAFQSGGKSSGFAQFSELVRDPVLSASLVNSLIFVVVSVVLHLFFGLLLAILLNQELNPVFIRTMRSLFLIPWAISPVVVATVWRLVYHPELSMFSGLWKMIPVVQQGPLAIPSTALAAVILINVWFATPFYLMFFLARLQATPKGIYEAAIIDGAGAFSRFRYITLPSLRDLIVTLAIFDVIAAFNTFDLIWLTTQGGPIHYTEVLATYIYKIAFRQLDFPLAAAAGIVLLGCILLLSGLIWKLRER